MNTSRKAKNAFLTSLISLVLCFSMLLGTTYAWFTDTASTGVNKIQAGTLDVQLLMYKDGSYVDISENPDPIFGTGDRAQNNNAETLWEPGKTQVAYLAIKNNGTLALKYKVGLNVINPAESKELWKVMQYAITPDATNANPVSGWTNGNSVVVGQQVVSGNDDVSLPVGATHYFALSVHMMEEAGNEYKNGKVNFDLTVYAAQQTAENDSFGPNYDADAKFPVSMIANVTPSTTAEGVTTVASEVSISSVETVTVGDETKPVATFTIPNGVKLESDTTTKVEPSITETATPANITIDAGSTSKTLEIKVAGVAANNTTPITVETYIDARLGSITLYHNDTLMAASNYSYNNETGLLTLKSATFSPFTVVYAKDSWEKHAAGSYTVDEATQTITINSAAELALLSKNMKKNGNNENGFKGEWTVNLTANLDMSAYLWTPIDTDGYHGQGVVTLNGNSHTIKGLTDSLFSGGFAGTSGIVINNLTLEKTNIVNSTETQGIGAFISNVDSMPTIKLDDCHLKNSTIVSTGGARVGGLIGWTSGYDKQDDGPVDTYVTVKNCSVENCSITAAGSVGAIIGHAGSNSATYHTITGCTVKDCTLNSTDDGDWRVGVVVGTANVGEVTISNTTESGNTLTQTGKTAPEHSNLYGRFVTSDGNGKLTIDGVKINN